MSLKLSRFVKIIVGVGLAITSYPVLNNIKIHFQMSLLQCAGCVTAISSKLNSRIRTELKTTTFNWNIIWIEVHIPRLLTYLLTVISRKKKVYNVNGRKLPTVTFTIRQQSNVSQHLRFWQNSSGADWRTPAERKLKQNLCGGIANWQTRD